MYEDQSYADTLSATESNQTQPDRLAILVEGETLEVTTQTFDYLLRQAVHEFEQKVNTEETQ